MFSTVRAKYEDAASEEDEAIAEAMTAYWSSFARGGDPNGAGLPEWPAYDVDQDVLMDFAVGGPKAKPDPFKARLDWVERLASSPTPQQ